MGKRILAVARDENPKRGFEALAAVSGGSLQLMVGKSFTEEAIKAAVEEADVVLVGMSSSKTLSEIELFAANAAIALQKPLCCYGDIAGAFNREWFAQVAPYAAVYFGASPNDASNAKKVFSNATCYGFGNPLDETMTFSRFTREEIRKRFLVASNEIMVLAPGTKTIVENCFMWANLIDILERLHVRGFAMKLILAPHPKDRSVTAKDGEGKELTIYEEFVTRSPFPVSILGSEAGFSSSDVLPGADLVVAFGGSIGRETGFKRIPVLSIGTEIAFRRMKQESGDRIPEAVSLGLARLISDENSIRAAQIVGELLDKDGSVAGRQMKRKQEEFCVPPPYRGYAIEQMWQVLTDLL